jgi:lipoprotein-releasing system ATP-binding protein
MNDAALAVRGLKKSFFDAGRELKVLDGVDLTVARGDRVAIVGASGSGKTTLLQLLGGLDEPTAGEVWVAGSCMSSLGNTERGLLRNRALGFVYQFHHLLPEFTALENVAMPLLVRGMSSAEAAEQAEAVLARVGLVERLTHRPGQLSGGERQRTAVARALVTRPAVVLADEPTGNLDAETAHHVFDLLLRTCRERNANLIVASHSAEIATRAERVIVINSGRIEDVTS